MTAVVAIQRRLCQQQDHQLKVYPGEVRMRFEKAMLCLRHVQDKLQRQRVVGEVTAHDTDEGVAWVRVRG